MRVLVSPDNFTGTLSAPAAAEAIAAGWRRAAPDDLVTCAPMADGGPGFVAVLHHALGGRLEQVAVRDALGRRAQVDVLVVDRTAYLESAQACGPASDGARDPWRASTAGVGQAIRAAVDLGVDQIVVGLGGSSTADGGAGMLAALGADADVSLDAGPAGLDGVGRVDVSTPRGLLEGVDLVMATDVTTVLLGMFGATRTFGPQKGLGDADIVAVDRILDDFVVAACGPTPAQRRIAEAAGAGAAGGLGFGLLVLGAQRRSGIEVVADATGLSALVAEHDLVLTGEGAYDFTSRSGKVVFGVAEVAARHAKPCVVLAGQVDVGAREMRAMGVESAYAMSDMVGLEAALARPAESLTALAERAARTWSS